MSSPPRWPLVVVALGCAFAGGPLVTAPGMYLQDLANDAIRAPAWHMLAARQLASGEGLSVMTGWGWPAPPPAASVLPPAIDRVLPAPLWWVFGWPLAWRLAQVGAVVVNGVGAAALARAARLGWLGTVVTGLSFGLCPLLWREILLGKPNTAVPGLAALALAATLRAVEVGGWRVLLAAVLGALAAGMYPPNLVLLAPAAIALLVLPVREAGRAGALRLGGALAGGAVLAAPMVWQVVSARGGKGLGGLGGECPDLSEVVLAENLARWGPPAWVGEIAPWLPAVAWLGIPAALGWTGRRGVALLLAAVCLGYAAASLGNCPAWSATSGPWTTVPQLDRLVTLLNALGRLLMVSALLLALLTGGAVDAAWRWERRAVGRVLGGGLAVLALLGAALPWAADYADERHFKLVATTAQARLLEGRAPGPIADLPYDQAGQYVVALQTPDRPRVNPPTPFTPRYRADPLVSWLHDLGDGRLPGDAPTRAQAAASGVRWVLHDRSRCDHVAMRRPEPCAQRIRDALTRVLGPPVAAEGAVELWAVPEGPRPPSVDPSR